MEAALGREEEVDGDFDLEATIADFVRDEARTSLELPRTLSTEQRKVARRLADQHPELKCHSYGIGTDRQLHLFKKGKDLGRAGSKIGVIGQDRPDGGSTHNVRVKNTFIDDWIGGEDDTKSSEEPLICRSMPAGSAQQQLLERTLQQCLVDSHPLKIDEANLGLASPGSSTGHEGGYMGSSPGSSSQPSAPELPPSLPSCLPDGLPEGLQVSMRNTFIHIESVPVVERIVQSMPDGMFRQCLMQELSSQNLGDGERPDVVSEEDSSAQGLTGPLLSPAPPGAVFSSLAHVPPGPALAPPPSAAVPSCPPPMSEPAAQFIALGTEVIIQNLVKLPAFNGLSGTVQSLDAASGRYDVLLCDPSVASGWRRAKVKGDNLIVTVPPPPPQAPTILLEACIHEGAAEPKVPEEAGAPLSLSALV